jgi:hypothetical protein
MAGDWIKVEGVTPDKPEVISIAATLSIDQDAAIGKLIRLWIWADQQTFNGNAGGNGVSVTKAFIDRCTGVTGFADAMQKAGWLRMVNGRITFPNFDLHNGETAKSRALASKRQNRLKQRRKQENESQRKGNAKGNADGVTSASPREEKRREDLKSPKPPLENEMQIPETLRCPEFDAAFTEWVKVRELDATEQKYLMARLTGWGVKRSIAAIQFSLANGYKGLIEEKANGQPAVKSPRPTISEDQVAEQRRKAKEEEEAARRSWEGKEATPLAQRFKETPAKSDCNQG